MTRCVTRFLSSDRGTGHIHIIEMHLWNHDSQAILHHYQQHEKYMSPPSSLIYYHARSPAPSTIATTASSLISLFPLLTSPQSVPATRLAYEKLAAGMVDRPSKGQTYRRDLIAAEDSFKPEWMTHEDQQREQKQDGTS